MKIRCITEFIRGNTIGLVVDKEYIVYALSEYYDEIHYCICDETHTYYPMWIEKKFFEIADNRLSYYWVFSFQEGIKKDRFFFGFPEWANRTDFYDNLVDGEEEEIEIFRSYKKLMDLEYPDSSILKTAQIGDDQWLLCPQCIDAWQSADCRNALVECPKCLEIFNNPRYKDEWPHS